VEEKGLYNTVEGGPGSERCKEKHFRGNIQSSPERSTLSSSATEAEPRNIKLERRFCGGRGSAARGRPFLELVHRRRCSEKDGGTIGRRTGFAEIGKGAKLSEKINGGGQRSP